MSLMSPVPLAVQAEPGPAAHVHEQPVSAGGTLSSTFAPVASLGTALVTEIAYVSASPGRADVTPSLLLTARSADWVSVSVSVALLLPGTGSSGAVTVAVLLIDPVAPDAMVQDAV